MLVFPSRLYARAPSLSIRVFLLKRGRPWSQVTHVSPVPDIAWLISFRTSGEPASWFSLAPRKADRHTHAEVMPLGAHKALPRLRGFI